MDISVRAIFRDPAWRDWLQTFPDYDGIGGHIPSLKFRKEVQAHLIQARKMRKPDKADHALLKSELEEHFGLIGAQISKKTEVGILAAITGGLGLAADFFLPGSSYALTWISGMLIAGGAASKFSAARELFHIQSARIEIILWLRQS